MSDTWKFELANKIQEKSIQKASIDLRLRKETQNKTQFSQNCIEKKEFALGSSLIGALMPVNLTEHRTLRTWIHSYVFC